MVSLRTTASTIFVLFMLPGFSVANSDRILSEHSSPGLPFNAVELEIAALDRMHPGRVNRGYAVLDVDGDGKLELVADEQLGQVVRRYDGALGIVTSQWSLPSGYSGVPPFSDLLGYDGDGDGKDDVLILAYNESADTWTLWLRSIAEDRMVSSLDLPIFEDRDGDGQWDGQYDLIAEVSVPDRPRAAVILACYAEWDVHGRGLVAVDPVEGVVLWHTLIDESLSYPDITVEDFDADGRKDIICGTRGVANLQGQTLRSAGDDSSRVLVFNSSGELTWSRGLAGPGTAARVVAADLDGNGSSEVIASCLGNTEKRDIRCWSFTGGLLDIIDQDGLSTRWMAAIPATPAEGGRLAVAIAGKELVFYVFRDGEFIEAKRRPIQTSRIFAMDAIHQAPGLEVLAAGRDQLGIWDGSGNALAELDWPLENGYAWEPVVWSVGDQHTVLLSADSQRSALEFVAAPIDWRTAAKKTFGTVAAAAIGLAAFFFGRWKTGRQNKPDAAVLKELRLQLMSRIEKTSHGKAGAIAILNSLVLLASHEESRAIIAGSVGEPLGNHMAERIRTYLEESDPRLQEIHTLGRHIDAPADILQRYDSLLSQTRDHLRALLAMHEPARRSKISQLVDEADQLLESLWTHASTGFRCSLDVSLQRVLDAQRDFIAEFGVVVSLSPHQQTHPLEIAIDSEDLAFILDNLVENAVRAMKEAPERRLAISWTPRGTRLELLVQDTGCGIRPDDQAAVFQEGWSTREGGGLGLARSREDLRAYGGDLRIEKSAPGAGTTFSLALPLAGC